MTPFSVRSMFRRAFGERRKVRLVRRRPRLAIERLENRLALAVTSFSFGVLTVDLNAASEAFTLSNNGTNITLASSALITGAGPSFTTANVNRIVFSDTGALAGQSLAFNAGTALTLSGGLLSTAVETVTFNNAITATGASTLSITAPRNIVVNANITGGSGGLTLSANRQFPLTSGTFIGVDVSGATITTTGNGNVSVTGRGGATSSSNYGVRVRSAGQITAGGSGTVTVTGSGGASSGASNVGVLVAGASSQITSSGGAVLVEGTGTSNSEAVRLQGQGLGTITSGSNAAITITADSVNIIAGSGGINSGAGTTTIRTRTAGTQINLGGADVLSGKPLTLGLTSAELNQITAGTLIIGDTDSGNMTISAAIARASATNVELRSGGNVVFGGGSFNTGGGTLLLDPNGSGSVQPLTAGVDATASIVSFASDLGIAIDGTTVNTQYNQFQVAGTVNLTGVNLVLSGAYAPVPGNVFTIVSTTGMVVGQFTGLPNGAKIIFNGVNLAVAYTATTVTLTAS